MGAVSERRRLLYSEKRLISENICCSLNSSKGRYSAMVKPTTFERLSGRCAHPYVVKNHKNTLTARVDCDNLNKILRCLRERE